ncbi:MAG TPA: alpha/beta hydrolase [Conexibacter sp.]|jgi:acetyl esterase|nr:alpha/beta hydrolase [Conexibacter sp.]
MSIQQLTVHPQAAALIAEIGERLSLFGGSEAKPITAMSPVEAREQMALLRGTLGEGPPVPEVRDLTIPTADADLPARLYRVAATRPAGLWVWFHGGGCVVGELEEQDAVCRLMAQLSGCDVLNASYRLAPEHPFPAAALDAYRVVAWAAEELAEDLPLIVGGESAGGCLAAVAALQAKVAGTPQIAAQVLVHPMLGADFDTDSYLRYGGGEYLLGRELMTWFWDHYAPQEWMRSDPLAVPLQAEDLSGLPPATVVIAELDPLRDEGEAYAQRLAEAGVDVDVRIYEGVMHGFWCWANRLDPGREAVAAVCARLHETLRRSAALPA